MDKAIVIAGISGSLRRDSYNTLLLKNCTELLPGNATMKIISIAELPLYNADLDLPSASKRPPAVELFRNQLAEADALIVVSPEYNYSIPGGLKNAIDWASRGEDSPLLRKPIAIMGATTGLWGTTRMQIAFHPIFQFLDMKPVYKPEIMVANAKEKFDEHGYYTDEKGKALIRKKIEMLISMALQA